MKGIYLLLGGNEGDRLAVLARAVEYIDREIGNVLIASSTYESEPWGHTDQPYFLNRAIEVESNLTPRVLLEKILEIERELGRIRGAKWSQRVIDIDILYYGDRIVDEPGLHIPHPEIQNRRFALVPMTEIAPDLIHPELKEDQRSLLAKCPDHLDVHAVVEDL